MPSGPDSPRLFFALVPPNPIRRRIRDLQSRLDLPARPVAAANFHITLAFLGQVPAQRVPKLESLACGLAMPLCILRLDRLGAFPRAGVAWLGCGAAPHRLLDFQADLSGRLAEAGFRAEERRWRPHVTLYRKMRKSFDRMEFEAIDWSLDGFSLMRSDPGDKGPVYTPLASWNSEQVGDESTPG